MPADIDPSEPTIRTDRLVLRKPCRDDIPMIVAGTSDFAVAGMLARVPHPYAVSDAEEFLKKVDDPENRERVQAITRNDGLIGMVSLTDFPQGELGYWLAREHWGQGLMTEAVAAFLATAFAVAPDVVIRSGAFTDNPASLRIQEKLGFERIGVRQVFSLARKQLVAHADTRLTHDRFAARRASATEAIAETRT